MTRMPFAIIGFPILLAAVAVVVPSNRLRPWLVPAGGLVHLVQTSVVLLRPSLGVGWGWLSLDPPGRVVLGSVSVLYFLCSIYTVGYLHHRQNRSNRAFCGCLLSLLGMMSLIIWSQHLGLMWVAIEASTLSTGPLIYFNRTPRAIEATWKYLLVGSVGIALALMGSFFLAYASVHEGLHPSLLVEDLLREAKHLSKPWLHGALVLLLVGYGTKMGLAPMHTWKPDAYGEASGVVGALLAGGLTNCAFLALLRIYHITNQAGEGLYTGRLFLFMGLLSMAVAAVFTVGQRDFKRMLAYSSVEHMGILTLALGIGGAAAIFGALLHLINNALTKGVLFLSAANIQRSFGGKTTEEVSGAMRRVPLSGATFLAGFFAITGSPPFGPFISEFSILQAAFGQGRYGVGALFLVFLLVVFIGMGQTVLLVVQGRPPSSVRPTSYRDGLLTSGPILVLLGLVLCLGVFIPASLSGLLWDAARFLETTP
jgi:hydrogenase-4 component F